MRFGKPHGVAWFVPKFDHPFARMSAYITTLRSVVDELVRERVQSDAVESTRWCVIILMKVDLMVFSFCPLIGLKIRLSMLVFKRFLKDVEAKKK